ncbi:hypothetical protein NDU88_005169 [Pleurodeles waltl]|uniref:Uncharacterized protein n=1 Tax=Pleurodeles waltl TaxID=8319 RepID=A0AAV7SL25_PLEWA|nr:hypothetical protein NDU88_005169 [Pleurodeles waltl]
MRHGHNTLVAARAGAWLARWPSSSTSSALRPACSNPHHPDAPGLPVPDQRLVECWLGRARTKWSAAVASGAEGMMTEALGPVQQYGWREGYKVGGAVALKACHGRPGGLDMPLGWCRDPLRAGDAPSERRRED